MPEDKQSIAKRPRYFDGQYLNVDDFVSEQEYHIDRQRRISKFLQISGILEGLDVTVGSNTQLTITPGAAIDDQGQQILLRSEAMFRENLLQSSNRFVIDLSDISKFSRTQSYNLWITWRKVESDPQTEEALEKDKNTRFYERPEIQLLPSQNKPEVPSVFLAVLNASSDGFTVGQTDLRQYSGLKLPAKDGKGVTLRSQDGASDRAILTGSLSVTGNVGIGTTSPAAKLAINGGLHVGGDSDPGDKNLLVDGTLSVNGESTLLGKATIQPSLTATASNQTLSAVHIKPIVPTSSYTGIQLNGLIVESGNVGIGTTNPAAKLEVNTGGGKTTSLKCEHNGSNFIVRPKSGGDSSTIIENTGGGKLLISPSADVEIGSAVTVKNNGEVKVESISTGGKILIKTANKNKYIICGDSDTIGSSADKTPDSEFKLEMACSRTLKENILSLSSDEAIQTLIGLRSVKYDYKGERAFRQILGFIAEEMPDNLASQDRQSLSPFEVIPVLTKVIQLQQESIKQLQEKVDVIWLQADKHKEECLS
ncbi:tail fiber domain-containing protein [Stenomitos frigidus]|uniref:Peptidase S74 domain-containing protein n=1 Tax=Stenomitos frigidus ULC18 TaxID=2107698 RepID=A0A2T1ENU2_9CYAN|nr:tail fiber domain-containing protein [Stenomitos frigidus]PSB34420.1 hypothetical protein C7B82_02855 [Stenomitos frigidus ULC18]